MKNAAGIAWQAGSLEARIASHFEDSARLKQESSKQLSAPIARGIGLMAAALRAGGKVLACGNGGSAADAQHFAAELVNRCARSGAGATCCWRFRPRATPPAFSRRCARRGNSACRSSL
jgi:hypothetical protein